MPRNFATWPCQHGDRIVHVHLCLICRELWEDIMSHTSRRGNAREDSEAHKLDQSSIRRDKALKRWRS